MGTDLLLSAELRLLAYTAFLCLILWVPYILAAIMTRGLATVVSYPSGKHDDLPDWAQRAHRAHINLVENLAPFAALVLVAHVSGNLNDVTEWGAHLFFWARIAQVIIQYIGIPWLRTAAFTVGFVGNVMIFSQLLV